MSVLPDKYYSHSSGCKYCDRPNWVRCVECQSKYEMPHPYCCLDECGEHGFCRSSCDKGIYKKKDQVIIMVSYTEVESLLRSLPEIETVNPYRCDNVITPNVVGFVPLKDRVEVEITYGTWMNGEHIIGCTLFENFRGEKRRIIKSTVNQCFLWNEIDALAPYLEKLKRMPQEDYTNEKV